MYNWKFINVTKEQLESMEDVQIETVATIKERIYPDNLKSFLSFFKESTLNQVFDLAILLGKMVDVFHIFTALRFVVKNFLT